MPLFSSHLKRLRSRESEKSVVPVTQVSNFRMEGKMRRHLAACLFALSFVLGVTSKGLAGTDGFTTIDFPGATFNSAIGINSRGDIVGQYNTPGRVHGYLWREGEFASIDFPGASLTITRGINSEGDIVGQYTTIAGVTHGFLLSR